MAEGNHTYMANLVVRPSSCAPIPFSPKRIVARVLLAGLEEPICAVLGECFKQFGVQAISSRGDAETRLQKEKFEACVVALGRTDAESILTAARTSASNSRIVIYGIAGTTQEAMRFSRLGINAIIDDPVERQAALKVVRSTHLLVVHELRRYVRIPVVTEVHVDYGQSGFQASSVEISAGGMSMRTDVRLPKEHAVEVSFSLPPNGLMVVSRATVCWKRDSAEMVGIRFDPTDERRLEVKRWIDGFLEIG